MVLPGMGVISELIPTFTRRTIFGYKAIAYSSVGIAMVGTFVWGHHMYTSGQSFMASVVFFIGVGVVLHMIGITNLPDLKIERD